MSVKPVSLSGGVGGDPSSALPAFNIVIPARFASTRLPGKPLRLIAGKPMVQWVYEVAVRAGAEQVVVATEDLRIRDVVQSFGGVACMTGSEHSSGTHRIAEVAAIEMWDSETIVVNLQGDEPLMEPRHLSALARLLHRDPEVGIATMATAISCGDDLFNPNIVKVVLNAKGCAQLFSRAPIPWVRGVFGVQNRHIVELPPGVPFLRHLGIYAYRVRSLVRMSTAAEDPHERAESLEQLRALNLGIGIRVAVVADGGSYGVDTVEDLARVDALLSVR